MKSKSLCAFLSVFVVAGCDVLLSREINLEGRTTIPVSTKEDVTLENFNWVVSVEMIGLEESCRGVKENLTELGVFFPNHFKNFRLPQVHSWVDERDDVTNETSNPVRTRLLAKDTITLLAKTNQLEIVLWSFSSQIQPVLLQVGWGFKFVQQCPG